MEMKIVSLETPSAIVWNYDELKEWVSEKLETYNHMVYSDSQIKEAKQDKASLNRLKKALNDERLAREKEYMRPFTEFKSQVNEIIAIIDEPIKVIDAQIKAAEESRKEEKRHTIEQLFLDCNFPEWLQLEQIADPRWLNATYTEKQISDDMAERNYKILCDMRTINSLQDFSFEAEEVYKKTLDLGKAIEEGQRLADIQRRKEASKNAENEQKTMEQQIAQNQEVGENVLPVSKPEEVRYWIKFEAFVTVEEARALKAYFRERNITIK